MTDRILVEIPIQYVAVGALGRSRKVASHLVREAVPILVERVTEADVEGRAGAHPIVDGRICTKVAHEDDRSPILVRDLDRNGKFHAVWSYFPNLSDSHFAYMQPFSYYRGDEPFQAVRPDDLRRVERSYREDAVAEAVARSADLLAIGDAIHTRVVEPAFVLQDGYLKTVPVRIDGLGMDRPGDPMRPDHAEEVMREIEGIPSMPDRILPGDWSMARFALPAFDLGTIHTALRACAMATSVVGHERPGRRPRLPPELELAVAELHADAIRIRSLVARRGSDDPTTSSTMRRTRDLVEALGEWDRLASPPEPWLENLRDVVERRERRWNLVELPSRVARRVEPGDEAALAGMRI